MHCVSEGIVKKLMESWFSSKFAERPFSLVRNLDIVDKRLHRRMCVGFLDQ